MKFYKNKYSLFTLILMLGFIFCNTFHPIPTQVIDYDSELVINLRKYILLEEEVDLVYNIHDKLNIRDSNDSLFISSLDKSPGLSTIKLNVNNKDIDIVVYCKKNEGYDSIPSQSTIHSTIAKDQYKFIGDDIILDYKNVSRSVSSSDLRNSNIKILFNNNIIKNKYIHIFKDKIRIMLPRELKDGMLRICATDEYENLYRENQTIISNGFPLSNSSKEFSDYFSNIYYLMVDRFSDKNDNNNLTVNDLSIDKSVKFHGGDLSGVLKKINNGYFDRLGISTILLSPIHSNPDSSFRESIAPFKKQMGFDGSWPINLTSIDSRFGNNEDLRSVVSAIHKKDMKVFMEFIAGHTHNNHLYYELFPHWYNTNYLNWEELFLPQFELVDNHLIDQLTLDAKYWLDEFEVDGLFLNLNHSLSSDFSLHYNTSVDSARNKHTFHAIKFSDSFESAPEFINPIGFESEINFPLYLNAREHFSGLNTDFIELNKMIINNLEDYSSINLVTTIVGIDDQPRFISVADGQVSYKEKDVSSYLRNIEDPVSYEKLFMFMVMNNSLPGVPMLYYGDEYGQTGGYDADSKRDMKFQNELSISESYLKERVSKLNKLRSQYPALSVGDFMILRESKEFTAWLKSYYNEKILVFFNLQNKVIEKNISLPFEANELISLLDNSRIILDDPNMASLVIPPYKTGIYILKSK